MSKTKAHSVKADWHRADIVAAVHKKGSSLAALSRQHKYSNTRTLNNALDRHWPKGEQIIADFLGITPEEIWPSRYKDKPSPKFNTVEPDHKLSRRVA